MADDFWDKITARADNDGLVSRGGYRRILPPAARADDIDDDEYDYLTDRLNELVKTLQGQDAAFFERRLAGDSVAELAEHFGKTAGQAHRWQENIVRRLKKAAAKPALEHQPGPPVFYEFVWDDEAGTYIERRYTIRDGEKVLLGESWAGDHQK